MTTTYYPRPAVLDEIPSSGHVVIEASAGTGKTYTLEHLVVDLVVSEGARLSEIVAVTFTNKATAELRLRVREMLRRVAFSDDTNPRDDAWELDERTRVRVRAELADFSSAAIFTIHGFCHSVLRDFAFDHGLPFGADLVDERSLFEDSLIHEVRFAPERGMDAWLEALLYSGMDIDNLVDRAFRVSSRNMEVQPFLWPEDIDELQRSVRTHMARGDKLPKKLSEVLRSYVIARFSELARTEFERRRARSGALTYSDMLDHVHRTLVLDRPSADAFVEAIRVRYRFALIDEFQDTDRLQWEIFRRLFADDTPEHRLIVVGDPKQSIYGFRGADVATYRQARDEIAGENHDRLVHLATNYRSSKVLVDACHEIFRPGTSDYFSGSNRYDVPSSSGITRTVVDANGAAVPPITSMLLDVDPAMKLTSSQVKAAFNEAITDSIASVLREPSLRCSDGSEIQPSDIFVLTRSNAEAAEIADALRERSISVTLYRQEGLFQTDEARQVYELLRGVAAPHDRSHRRHAYLTDFFAIPLGEVENADAAEATGYTPRERLRRWSDRAALLRFERLFESILVETGLVRRLLLLEEGERAVTNYRHIFEILTHEARHSGADMATLVTRLKTWIDGIEQPDSFDVDAQRRETDRQAVQVMTIHKSKGLQAEFVYLFGGFTPSSVAPYVINHADGDPLAFLYKDILKDEGWEAHFDSAQHQEAERLYYVALTRAKSKLYLPHVPYGCNRGRHGEYEVVQQRLDQIEPDGKLFDRVRVELPSVEATPARDWSPLANWVVPELASLAPRGKAEFADARTRHGKLVSYTSLKASHADLALAAGAMEAVEEDDFFAEEDERFVDIPILPRNATAGSFLHAILEDLDYGNAKGATFEQWVDNPETISVIEARFREFRYDLGYRSYAERVIFDTLRTSVDLRDATIPSLAHVENTSREARFVYPVNTERDDFAQGFVDLLFEWDGKYYFADWKSDTPPDGFAPTSIAQIVNDRYPVQASVYTVALTRLLGIDTPEAYEAQFGGFCYFFVRGIQPARPGHGIYFARPGWDDYQRWEETLEEVAR